MSVRIALAAGVLAACAASAGAQETESPPRRAMTAVRASDADRILVDGRLDEPIWLRAAPATDFLQQDPDVGEPATERTEVRIVYDETTLYMGVHCFDDEPGRHERDFARLDDEIGAGDQIEAGGLRRLVDGDLRRRREA